MRFEGFDSRDFDLFSIPDFAGRMVEIRGHLRPKLLALAEDLREPLETALGKPMLPHVAQHMRRRVNPPPETWAAFCRDRRGYKRWTHYRVAVSGAGVRVTVFVEDDADDKPVMAENLERKATTILKALPKEVRWYTLEPEASTRPFRANRAALIEAGNELGRLKTLKFQAGIPLPREEALGFSPEQFETWAVEQAVALKPLYLAGTEAKLRL
jgi:uncharacterized protein YktB (UPF0637 family)